MSEAALTITKDEARTLLLSEHNIAIGDDDPILMAVTLHAAFMQDMQRLLEKHDQAHLVAFDKGVSTVLSSVTEAADKLRDALLDGAVRSVLAGVAQQAEAAGLMQSKSRSYLIAQSVLTALQWIALVAFFFILK